MELDTTNDKYVIAAALEHIMSECYNLSTVLEKPIPEILNLISSELENLEGGEDSKISVPKIKLKTQDYNFSLNEDGTICFKDQEGNVIETLDNAYDAWLKDSYKDYDIGLDWGSGKSKTVNSIITLKPKKEDEAELTEEDDWEIEEDDSEEISKEDPVSEYHGKQLEAAAEVFETLLQQWQDTAGDPAARQMIAGEIYLATLSLGDTIYDLNQYLKNSGAAKKAFSSLLLSEAEAEEPKEVIRSDSPVLLLDFD